VQSEAIVPDELPRIQETIRAFSAQGLCARSDDWRNRHRARDVTPEAIRGIMRVELPGFGEAMRMESLKITPNAILSRSLAAVVDQSLVIAFPGKPSGAVECLGFVAGAIPHAVKLAQRVPTSC
jgi:molybdopterin adenylyltransferase